jgi:hypothetical protein
VEQQSFVHKTTAEEKQLLLLRLGFGFAAMKHCAFAEPEDEFWSASARSFKEYEEWEQIVVQHAEEIQHAMRSMHDSGADRAASPKLSATGSATAVAAADMVVDQPDALEEPQVQPGASVTSQSAQKSLRKVTDLAPNEPAAKRSRVAKKVVAEATRKAKGNERPHNTDKVPLSSIGTRYVIYSMFEHLSQLYFRSKVKAAAAQSTRKTRKRS